MQQSFKQLYFRLIPFPYREKIKFKIQTNVGGILVGFVEGTSFWPNLAGHIQSKTHGVAVFEYFQIRSFAMILRLNFSI